MLVLHRAERSDRLAEALAALLREPLGDPFAAEIVAVPSKGVERWLAQRLAHRLGTGNGEDGVCANVRFPSVTGLIELAGRIEQIGAPGRGDQWGPDRLVWPLLEVIDECLAEPWCRTLAAYLGALDGDPVRRGRRYATARHLAGLLDSYGLHRPEMLRSWSAGDDVDGLGGALPDDLRWQAGLWRRLAKRMTVPSPAERLTEMCDALRHDPGRSPLPDRISVFGLTRLPAAHVALLEALAAGRDVHLWLPHPSPALWERLRPHVPAGSPVPRAADRTRDLPRNPLLGSLGRDARELQLTLAKGRSIHHAGTPFPASRLGRLQRAIAADEPMAGAAGPDAARANAAGPDAARANAAGANAAGANAAGAEGQTHDRSVQVHACHGPDRQVEVLREVILGLLAADPALEPRDILVMCPDIESYAPLISASFGLGADAAHPAHRLRVRLADRSLRRLNPLLDVVAHLLGLADARMTAAQVLDLAALPPVRRRFRFDDDDLDRLRELVVESGVRWGLDAEHRSKFLVPARSNTWVAGLDRILLGVAMSEDEPYWLGTALPLDDMDSGDADLAGRLAELVDRLAAALGALTGERPLSGWLGAIGSAVDALTSVADADGWQAAQVRRELAGIAEAADGDASLTLSDVRSLVEGRLRGSPTRANFRTGDLTMCTMVPMRSVPHRVICVLGLDDGVFPRGAGVDGDDVLGRVPCVGERDPRGEDRQLLLDAVMAATGTLVLLYSGADERTNAPRSPAVPLAELLDALGPEAAAVVTRHPLQPFDPRHFIAPAPFSFDEVALAGALAATGERAADPPFLAAPLAPIPGDIELGDLQTFFTHPVRAFARRRLGIGFAGDDGEPADGLPVELDPLAQWAVGDRLLRSLLAGTPLDRCVQAEWRRGVVPPGPLGTRLLNAIAAEAEPLARAALTHVGGAPEAVDVSFALPDGRTVTGTVDDVHGDTIVAVSYSKLAPKHRLRAWIDLLALTVARPGVRWRAVTIGRGMRGPSRSTAGPIDPAGAARLFGDLVALADEGLRAPVPLSIKASPAYAQCRLGGGDVPAAEARARTEWTRYGGGGEADDDPHRLVWGAGSTLDRLLAEPAAGAEPTRFGAIAMRLWEPLCRAETLDRPR
ncbi:exodeoxyribonuclease V subunit gamma [Actinoplanes sp. CA-030573]|uniref:exodeoxyribonuclease V subunit gamma n=1 Tax=Actinoplanes sp. CA-030573 TaxID=3239898 RepID=UPI003D8DCC1B